MAKENAGHHVESIEESQMPNKTIISSSMTVQSLSKYKSKLTVYTKHIDFIRL